MSSFSTAILSGGTDGKGIKVVATATLGTTIHTATTGTSNLDEVWLWAYNSHTANVELTIEFGGATDPDDHIVYTVPFDDGLHLIIPGYKLQNGLVVTAFAGTANVIAVNGYVNRITADA